MIKKFKKKPIVIEAIQIKIKIIHDKKALKELVDFVKPRKLIPCLTPKNKNTYVIIETLEGDHKGEVGDYIIKGIKGECYPCREDIFNATYEKVVSD